MVGHEILGVLAVVWSAQSGGQGLSKAKRRHLRTTARRLGQAPSRLRAYGTAFGGSPVEVPIPATSAVRVGLFDWSVATGL
jgi:hypothetical protein